MSASIESTSRTEIALVLQGSFNQSENRRSIGDGDRVNTFELRISYRQGDAVPVQVVLVGQTIIDYDGIRIFFADLRLTTEVKARIESINSVTWVPEATYPRVVRVVINLLG